MAFFSYFQICQRLLGINFTPDRFPSQRRWVREGLFAPESLRVQRSDEARFMVRKPLSLCDTEDSSSYCEGQSLSKNYEFVDWAQKEIKVRGFEFTDQNICNDDQLATYLSNEVSRQFMTLIDNLMNKLDADIFAEIYPQIKPSIAGVDKVILGSLSQNVMIPNLSWDAKIKAWEQSDFDSMKEWDYISGRKGKEFVNAANVAEGGDGYIYFSRNVVGDELYQIARGSYYIMQKSALQAGFYANAAPQSMDAIFAQLNGMKRDTTEKMVFQLREPSTGVIIDIVVTKTTNCNDKFSKWVITPSIEYQLYVPTVEGCTHPAPHMYKYNVCGLPEPVCTNTTPSYIAPRLCVTPSAVTGCASAAYGSAIALSNPAPLGSAVVTSPYGIDISTEIGVINAINTALQGVVNGGMVAPIGSQIEYQGTYLQLGVTYTVTLACGGSFTFTLGQCVGVPQPNNIVTPAITIKRARVDFTEDGTSTNDFLNEIVVFGKPNIVVNLPLANVVGIQAVLDAYMLAQGIQGTVQYSYFGALPGGQSWFDIVAVTNAMFDLANYETNGVPFQSTNFA